MPETEIILLADAELVAKIKTQYGLFVKVARVSIEHALKLGDMLIDAQRRLNFSANWTQWVEGECGVSARHANNFMRLARHRPLIEDHYQSGDVPRLSLTQALALIKPEAPTVVQLVAPAPAPTVHGLAAAVRAKAKQRAAAKATRAPFAPSPAPEPQIRQQTAAELAAKRVGQDQDTIEAKAILEPILKSFFLAYYEVQVRVVEILTEIEQNLGPDFSGDGPPNEDELAKLVGTPGDILEQLYSAPELAAILGGGASLADKIYAVREGEADDV